MKEFANYILNEKDLITKMEILYFLSPKLQINFDKSMIFKTEIAKMFLEYTKVQLDSNIVLTACLLCNCKKVDNAQKIGKLKTYAVEGAEHLETLGFDERFCKICEGVNRYSGLSPREPESDVLELIDQFGGMLIDRAERIGMQPDEALVLLEHRNLKSEYNRYLELFKDFVVNINNIQIPGRVNTTIFARLQKLIRETKNIPDFIRTLSIDYCPTVDKKIREIELINCKKNNSCRAMFTAEIEEKILKQVKNN